MRSPVSPVVASIYIEDLALRMTLEPKIWKRYVDDTFCVLEEKHVLTLLDDLNSQCPTIQFTMELEKDKSLQFLNTLLTMRGDGGINIGAYTVHVYVGRQFTKPNIGIGTALNGQALA